MTSLASNLLVGRGLYMFFICVCIKIEGLYMHSLKGELGVWVLKNKRDFVLRIKPIMAQVKYPRRGAASQ